jgi:hypothetical protein
MERLVGYMMIYSPNDIKERKSNQYKKLNNSLPPEHIEEYQEKYSSCNQKQIVQQMIFEFLPQSIIKVFSHSLDDRTNCRHKKSDQYKNNK